MLSMGLRYENGRLLVLDQTALPHQENWLDSQNPDQMVDFIQRLVVRGAPLIGVAAALALAHYVQSKVSIKDALLAAARLRRARPTAVNLMNAIDRLVPAVPDWSQVETEASSQHRSALSQISFEHILSEAQKIFFEDAELCLAMAERGASLINDGDGVLTHCNTGWLVTSGIGTALGVIRRAHEQGKKIHVYVDETRPLLQGARLTAWELARLKIPHTLICDNMAGFLMSQKKIKKVFVGADRIARNGDFANKIGTYSVAVLAHFHKVPFYVVAPKTTCDLQCASAAEIPIEQRPADEVRAGRSPVDCHVWNPAFDVTPRTLISGIVLDDRMM